jgi:DNA end-binding protein Ku
MVARAVASGTISFGLVSIPVKLFTATSSEQVRFNMLHAETKGRVKQQYVLASTGEVVDRKSMAKGYEYTRGQYVMFTEEELKKLEAEKSSSIEIVEFVPLSSVDLIQVEKTYYMGPDKGGDKAYKLLSASMVDTEKVAVGRWAARGKEQLVIIRPYRGGLLLHQMFYANEVRSFEEADNSATVKFRDIERELAVKLINELSVDAFDASKYHDEYADRVKAAVEQKIAGQEVAIVGEVPRAEIIDLFEALKQSLADARGETTESTDEERPKPLEKAKPRRTEREKKTGS